VYNSLGQEVAVLANEFQSPEIYRITFNADHLPSGVYFYRLQAGEFVGTKKMILIR
ncbi:MAG: T9SS type A sorting domain-containing protein, partial [Bacteroidota bacterium]